MSDDKDDEGTEGANKGNVFDIKTKKDVTEAKVAEKKEENRPIAEVVHDVYNVWDTEVHPQLKLAANVRMTYYNYLISSGFDPQQALILCKEKVNGL